MASPCPRDSSSLSPATTWRIVPLPSRPSPTRSPREGSSPSRGPRRSGRPRPGPGAGSGAPRPCRTSGSKSSSSCLRLGDQVRRGCARAGAAPPAVTVSTTARPSSGWAARLTYRLRSSAGDHAAGRALVEVQLGRQLVEAARPAPEQRLQRVALGHRDVVAADPIAVAELVDAHQLGQGLVEGRRVRFEPGGRTFLDDGAT